jgi:prepilin-type N-terminal cleavage/methylation domain-containing protein
MHHTHRSHQRTLTGFTLLEVLLVVTIIGVLTGIAIPRTRQILDGVAVRGAAQDAAAVLELARQTAMARGERVSVDIDSMPARLTMRAGIDTLRRRNEQAIHGVRFTTTRSPVVYSQLGMGLGVSNLTLIVSRGSAVETVTVSRLGRVRR